MEGTRITLVRKVEEQGFQFTIRTPGTPDRYREYTAEMDILWKRITAEARKADRDTQRLADLFVSFYFYWCPWLPPPPHPPSSSSNDTHAAHMVLVS